VRPCRLIPLLALALTFPRLAVADPAPRVEVVYVDPQKFTDLRNGYTQTDSARDFYLAEIRRYIEQRAGRRLADGDTFRVTITDVGLAGDYEARRPSVTNVRIIREVSPARIDLSFRLARADGTVLAEGERKLRGTGYPVGVGIDPADPLRYEKVLLDDWLRQDLTPRAPR
jgi:Protein of unknown function (DUF3016)